MEEKSEEKVELVKAETQLQSPDQISDQKSDQTQNQSADFNATEVKSNEEVRSFFHVTTRYKIIFICSLILLIIEGILIYAVIEGALIVPPWQVSIWTLAAACSVYSIVRKSLLGLIMNFILFFVISLLPVYSELGERFKPVIDLFTGN